MSERSQFYDRKINRRRFLRTGLTAATIGGVYLAGRGVSLNPPQFDPITTSLAHTATQRSENGFLISSESSETESQKPIIIVHRSGNSVTGIQKAFQMGAHYVDTDVIVVDDIGGEQLYSEHGKVPTVKLGRFKFPLPVMIDTNEAEFKAGRPPMTLEETFQEVARLNQQITNPDEDMKIFIEQKRGPFTKKSFERIFWFMREYNVGTIISDLNFDRLDYAKDLAPSDLKDSFCYIPKTYSDSIRIISEYKNKPRHRVLTNISTARSLNAEFRKRGIEIFADTNNPQQAERLYTNNVVDGFMIEPNLLSQFAQSKRAA